MEINKKNRKTFLCSFIQFIRDPKTRQKILKNSRQIAQILTRNESFILKGNDNDRLYDVNK